MHDRNFKKIAAIFKQPYYNPSKYHEQAAGNRIKIYKINK